MLCRLILAALWRHELIIIIIIIILYFIFSLTSTKPVGLKISYNMVCRLGWSAVGKKLRLRESVAEGDCIASL